MLRSKDLSRFARPRLEQQWRPLWTRLDDVWAWHVKEAAVMADGAYEVRRGVYAFFAVELDGVVAPRGLQELVHDFHVFLGLGVAVIVLGGGRRGALVSWVGLGCNAACG